jgi:hypothetical protein
MSSINPEEMAQAESVLRQVRDSWLKRPGVTAVDLGFKWKEGELTGQVAIRVHVQEKKPAAELQPWEQFPSEVAGIPVDIIEATYTIQRQIEVALESANAGRGERFAEIPLGVSIGNAATTAGTLGAKVIDRASGVEMILSNWHVLVPSVNVSAGVSIWQPGPLDGGREEDAFATLSRWVLGPHDAAVATLNGRRSVSDHTLEGRRIADAIAPRLGMLVWKSGRTSGYSEGFIDGVQMHLSIEYGSSGARLMRQVFRVVPRPGSSTVVVSQGGDSGAIWVDEASGKGVGLHFAGEVEGPEFALANELPAVLQGLNVRLPAQPAAVAPPVPPVSPGVPGPGQDQGSFWSLMLRLLQSLLGQRR